MRFPIRFLSLCLLASAELACASTRTATPLDAADGVERDVPITVMNNGWSDADVYALHLSQRVRLGFVTAHSTAALRVPRDMVIDREVQLLVHRIGERSDFVTDVVRVDSDQHGELDLQSVIAQSSLAVYPGPH
jgi:hypothetical protein